MRKFITNIVLFFIPIGIVLAGIMPFYAVALYSGEIKNIDDNIEKQHQNPQSLLGFGYSEQKEYYKVHNANYFKAKVISVGTSRVMQFKGDCFQGDFYNCGGVVSGNYNEYVNFLKNLSYDPEMIILGLDSWVFNDAWNKLRDNYETFIEIQPPNINDWSVVKSIFEDWKIDKWSFSDLENYPNNIGFSGRVKDSGYMYDGSYYDGNVYRNPTEQADYLFKDTLNRIENGIRRFEWGETMDPDTIVQLSNLLSYCKERKIMVVGFLTPYAPTVYETMVKSGNYGYMSEIVPACKELFDKYDYEFYDYMDGKLLGVTDEYFLDGFHGSEIVYSLILEDMILKESSIKKYTDLSEIQLLLKNSYSEKLFFDPDNKYNNM